jgi:solute carrier family 8 (sodium/calcium exchanger)
MPNRCVAGGCNNVANKEKHIAVHIFPKEDKIRVKWIRFIQFKRKDFEAPSKSSVICSAHFLRDSYESVTTNVKDCSQESGYRSDK